MLFQLTAKLISSQTKLRLWLPGVTVSGSGARQSNSITQRQRLGFNSFFQQASVPIDLHWVR